MNRRTRDAVDSATAGGISCAAMAVITAAVIAVGVAVWGFTVWFSGTKGAGDVHKDQNSASNREYWSARFNTDMQALQADQANLATLQQAATGAGATQQDRTNYLGAQLNCRTDAATYNADTGNVLGAQWLPAGFPSAVDATTYCGK